MPSNRNYFQVLHLHAIKAKSPFGHQIIIIQSGMSTFRRPVHEWNPLESMDIGRKLCGKTISNQTFRFSSRITTTFIFIILSLYLNKFSYFRLAVAIVRSMKNKQLNAYNEWNSKKPKPIESKVLDPSHEVINKTFKLSMHDGKLIKIIPTV